MHIDIKYSLYGRRTVVVSLSLVIHIIYIHASKHIAPYVTKQFHIMRYKKDFILHLNTYIHNVNTQM